MVLICLGCLQKRGVCSYILLDTIYCALNHPNQIEHQQTNDAWQTKYS